MKETQVNHRLRVLIAELGQQEGRTITLSEVARECAVSPNTISNFASNKSRRVDLRVIGLLIDYFDGYGMEVTLDDLFEIKKRKSKRK